MFKYLVSVALVAITASASGEEISAFQGGSIDLGAYQGIVYYVDEGDEFRVVTTLSAPESLVPVRFVARLSEDEHITISVPGAVGEPERPFDITRSNGKLWLSGQPVGSNMRLTLGQ
ncbi:MAG: hypothetical protein ABWZ57_00380 [Mesorhizobium sp.]